MSRKPWREIAAKTLNDPARRAEIDEHKRAMQEIITLNALRERRGLTQREVATNLEVSQARVWKIEHQTDVYVSTLREYVQAMGGKLELNAVFDDESFSLLPTD